MKNFHMVVLERLKTQTKTFFTEPFEVGWADEGIFFIKVHEINSEDTKLLPTVQISADGIDWIDFESNMPLIYESGTHYKKINNFGGWLRMKCVLTGVNPIMKLTIQLALKG